MRNVEEFRTVRQPMLDARSAESLIGSGFEEEIPDTEFAPQTFATESGAR